MHDREGQEGVFLVSCLFVFFFLGGGKEECSCGTIHVTADGRFQNLAWYNPSITLYHQDKMVNAEGIFKTLRVNNSKFIDSNFDYIYCTL